MQSRKTAISEKKEVRLSIDIDVWQKIKKQADRKHVNTNSIVEKILTEKV